MIIKKQNCWLKPEKLKPFDNWQSDSHFEDGEPIWYSISFQYSFLFYISQGRIQDFHWGGEQKIMCVQRAQNPKSLSAGIQGLLKGPGSSRGF